MSVPAYALNNPRVAHLRYRENTLADLGTMRMHCHMVPDTVSLDFVGTHPRPVVRMKGMISKLMPAESDMDMAQLYGIDEITFATGANNDQRPRMVCDYEFDAEQIKQLVDKGLFEDAFVPPAESLMSEELQIPMNVNLHVSQPENNTDPVVLLYQIQGLRSATMDKATSGYDLAEKFATVNPEYQGEMQRQDERVAQLSGGDLFADETLEAAQRERIGGFEDIREDMLVNMRPHERVRELSPDKELEFVDVYAETFPSEDYVPEDVIARQDKLEAQVREQEEDPTVAKFYRQLASSRAAEMDVAHRDERDADEPELDIDDTEFADEDFGDLFDEDEHLDDAQPTDASVTAEAEMPAVGEFDTDEPVADEPDTDEPAAEADAAESGTDDLFADEDLDDPDVVNETLQGSTYADEFDETTTKARRERQRRVAVEQSNADVVSTNEDINAEHDAAQRTDTGQAKHSPGQAKHSRDRRVAMQQALKRMETKQAESKQAGPKHAAKETSKKTDDFQPGA